MDEMNAPSLPPRGAWIEIGNGIVAVCRHLGRSPHGERGLKSWSIRLRGWPNGRSPHGERGLKSAPSPSPPSANPVAPPTGSVD